MRFLPLVLLAPSLFAADVCSSSPELRKWREDTENSSRTDRLKSIDELAAKYPDRFDIQNQRLSTYRWDGNDAWPAVRDAYVKRAEEHPDDPLAVTLGATALHRTDTPRALAMLNKVVNYPWAALKLAEIYQTGKFEDKAKAKSSFETYANACAEHLSRSADWVMSKVADTPLQRTMAKRLRARLDNEKTPAPEEYELLWALEFRSRPPAEHPDLRKQVAADVERLLAQKPAKRHYGTLLGGMKQSGASKEALTAFEERVLREAPASYAGYTIAYDRWTKANKQPEDHKNTEAWEAWKRAYSASLKQWAAQFTEATWLEDSLVNAQLETGELDEKRAVAAIGKSLNSEVRRNGPYIWTYAQAAGKLLKYGWAPEKAWEWMQTAWPLAELEDRRESENDTLTDERRKEIAGGLGYRGYVATDVLRAAKAAGKKALPPSLRAYLDGPMPAKKTDWTTRYQALALLASIDERNADALAYYQQALFSRQKAPQHFRGKLEDRLLDESKAAFLKSGGTEKAFALWSTPSGKTQELAEGRWEKPKKKLPAFELADVSGKNWKLAQFEGKAVLINLWATWCGPCRQELPHFQKLYEKTKERSDIQVISFNVDDELGLVEPYMKENGYTFPALAAYTLVQQVFDGGWAIPQNWLVDAKGNWIATQIGFDSSDSDWENSMIKRLEAAKQGKAPTGVED